MGTDYKTHPAVKEQKIHDQVVEDKSKPADRQEDFDDVDESEIDYEGEEKAHDRVNQIPNSQVNRNQQNKNSDFVDGLRSDSQ